MHARWIAVLLGASMGGLTFGVSRCIARRPAPMWEIEVRAVDARGQPVTRFGWSITDFTPGATLTTGASEATHPDGLARVLIPEHEVTLSIGASGLRHAVIGPFRPETITGRLDVRLEDLGVIEGVVTRDGKPMPGASVVLLRPSSNMWDGTESGLYYGFARDRGESNESGRFRIPTESEGIDLWVRAWKLGSAYGTTGPVRVGAPPIQVELHEGGSLQGHITSGPSQGVGRSEIELFRQFPGEEHALTTFEYFGDTVDSSGSFAFHNLAAGPWLVRLKPPSGSSPAPTSVPDEYVPFLVTIEEHETCRLEMDLRQPPRKLVAHLTMNGKPWNPVWPSLHLPGGLALRLDSSESDAEGRWTLRTRSAGRYTLMIIGNHHHDSSVPQQAWGDVELQAEDASFERALEWKPTDPPVVRIDRSR